MPLRDEAALVVKYNNIDYFVNVIIKVAIEIKVPTDDIPKDNAGGTFHD